MSPYNTLVACVQPSKFRNTLTQGTGFRLWVHWHGMISPLSCGPFWWPTLPNFTSPLSPSSLSVTGLGALLSSSLLKRRYISLQNEWINKLKIEIKMVQSSNFLLEIIWQPVNDTIPSKDQVDLKNNILSLSNLCGKF